MVSSETFAKLDDWMFHRAMRYAKHMHPNKSMEWRKNRYWGRLNKDREDRWVFGDKHSGRYLLKFCWFKIVRHALVRGTVLPRRPGSTGLLVGKAEGECPAPVRRVT